MKNRSVLGALLVTAALFPAITNAAPAAVWTGPGQMACRGQCSLGWALSFLDIEQREAIKEAMMASPLGHSIPIRDGTVFSMMSYFDEVAQADMRTTVAVLDADEPAVGWQFDGWSFVQITGCLNWAVVSHVPAISIGNQQFPARQQPETVTTRSDASFNFPEMATILLGGSARLPVVLNDLEPPTPGRPLVPGDLDIIPDDEGSSPIVDPVISIPQKPPTVVPLPWGIHLFLLSFAVLYLFRSFGVRTH
jgi:hypothetical protein